MAIENSTLKIEPVRNIYMLQTHIQVKMVDPLIALNRHRRGIHSFLMRSRLIASTAVARAYRNSHSPAAGPVHTMKRASINDLYTGRDSHIY